MEESKIRALIKGLEQDMQDVPRDVHEVFSVFVRSTLGYRDRLKKDCGIVVTVEDVRIALAWFEEWLHTQRMPSSNHSVRLELLNLWIRELADKTFIE